MRVYIVRHGSASHLLEDMNRKVSHKECLEIIESWNRASLTPLGKEEISKLVEKLHNMYSCIFYSPLKRTKQTAETFLNDSENKARSQVIPQLTELYISPPRLPESVRLKLKTWIYLCVAKSILTFSFFRYLLEARKIVRLVSKVNDDLLIISHQARIFSITVYALLSPYWKVVKTDYNPAGVSIIEKR